MSTLKALLNKSRLATGIICIVFGLVIPAILFFASFGEIKGALDAEAEINARLISKLIVSNPDMWRFETVRLEELLSRRSYEKVSEIRRVYDTKNNLVAESRDSVSKPEVSLSKNIIDSGDIVGKIEIVRSLRPLLVRTALIVLLGLVFSSFMYRLLPFPELARAAKELKEANTFLSHVLEASSNAIAVTDHEGKVIQINRGFELLTGRVQSEFLGRFIFDDVKGSVRPVLEAFYVYKQNKRLKKEFESTVERPDGQKRNIQCVLEPISEAGDANYIVLSAIDITESKRQEQNKLEDVRKFQEAQRLESLGVLAGGIAHDFNNILAIVMGHVCLAKMKVGNIADNLNAIEMATDRAAALCRQMMVYAGHADASKSQVDMITLVHEMVELMSSTGHRNITIKTEISSDVPTIHGDDSQIRQILLNFITNATQAFGEAQGEIDVILTKSSVNAVHTESDYLGRAIPEGTYVCLEVTDKGCGMTEEIKRRIFEPFFTTKFTGHGLGLSATLGIITGHEGALQVFSQPGMGTTFKVYLPALAGDTGSDALQQPTAPVPWHGSGTILLVDDEDQVRSIAKAILENFGFAVMEAGNGKEALASFHKENAHIDVVITDIGMPVMDGYQLFFELKKLHPGLPIIMSSGFGDKSVGSRIPEEDMAGFIGKPYSPDQLQELLKRVVRNLPDHEV